MTRLASPATLNTMAPPATPQWTCAYRGRSGARANATFSSVQQAKEFAEEHAGPSGRAAGWVETEWGWLLRLVTADYLVRPA
jgi:hypothetical protein